MNLKTIAVVVGLLFFGSLAFTFSGLDTSNTDCNWEPLTLENSNQTFSNYEEVKDEIGAQNFQDFKSQADNSEYVGLREHDPWFGEPVVQYKRCTVSEG